MENPKILIADDVDYLVEFMKSHLEQLLPDATYFRAANGYEVFTLAMRKQPDLILLDWEMPEISGMEALQTLQAHPQTKDIPVIMVSGFTQADHVRKALEAGAMDYLKKPIAPDELLARVRTAMTLADSMRQLRQQKQQLEEEKRRSDRILNGLLPTEVLQTMKEHSEIAPRRFRNVSVIMADLVDFTPKSQKMSPKRLLDELQTIFTAFDQICQKHNCTRIKTIGDAYLAVSGMWNHSHNHALVAAKMAERMRQYITEHNERYKIDWEIRIGINSGDIIAGIISESNLSYDIFGDTVNTATRMQSYCNPMQINVSQTTYDHLKDYYFMIKRISRKVKGKGALNMYYLHRPIQSRQQLRQQISHPQYAL